MNRSCNFILCGFLAGSVLSATAQQSAPAVPAPPPPVGTLAGHPDWPVAKNPGDVDTVDHLIASLYDVVSGTAGQRDWNRFRALFLRKTTRSHSREASIRSRSCMLMDASGLAALSLIMSDQG
jgi:hypothetical protein